MTNPIHDERDAAIDRLQVPRSASRTTAFFFIGGSALCGIAGPASAAGSVAGFAVAGKGGGTIGMIDGSRAAIRCRSTYGVHAGSDAMNVDVDCASYRVNIVASVVAQATNLSGQWQETTR